MLSRKTAHFRLLSVAQKRRLLKLPKEDGGRQRCTSLALPVLGAWLDLFTTKNCEISLVLIALSSHEDYYE